MKIKSLALATVLISACGDSASQEATNDASEMHEPSVAILQYHHVSASTPSVTSIAPEQFKAHLDYLKDNDFRVVSIEKAHERIESGESFPAKAVVITFDDGYKNVYHNAADLLEQYNMPYAVFVNPDLMEKSPSAYMGWQQLEDIQQRGATIVNHGQTHDHLIRRHEQETEQEWQERMHYDVMSAQRAIDKNLGEQPKYFAYPYGEYDPALQNLLAQWGFLGFAQHSGPWSPYSDKTAITRFPASGIYANLETLKTKLNSLALPVVNYSPSVPVLAHSEKTPTLQVELEYNEDVRTDALQCFRGSEVLSPEWVSEQTFTVTVRNDLPIGRSRINCTAPSKATDSYYWFSAAFIRPDENGSWPD